MLIMKFSQKRLNLIILMLHRTRQEKKHDDF